MAAKVAPIDDCVRTTAMHLYWMGWRQVDIAKRLGVTASALGQWKREGEWDEKSPSERVESVLETRLITLVLKDEKTGGDYKEIDLLGRQMERMGKAQASGGAGAAGREQGAGAKKAAGKKRNHLDEKQVAALRGALLDEMFVYQKGWYDERERRIRNILKSRQIGATYYFAREAIADAAESGRNKIFLSASRAQSAVFRNYIRAFVREVCETDLTGDPIILPNSAELHFLGTNANTAQSYHGDVYFDEYFWVPRFATFRKVVSGMAMHKKWRMTYFSTPSTITHEAFRFWSGEQFNKRRPRAERVEYDVSHKAVADGRLFPDRQWRQMVTIEDAIAGGCDLFDIDDLRAEYSPDEFANLLMCEFADDTLSAFPLDLQQGCMVDSWLAWDDVKPFAARPVGDLVVWIGYDPAGDGEGGDGAGVVVLLPPGRPGGKHRVIERHRLHGSDYDKQGAFVLSFLEKYNVEHIGIDVTGIGDAVAKVIARKFQAVTRYQYTPLLKTQMALQAQQVMRTGRFEFDAGWTDLSQAFMAIRKTMTASGNATTYSAGRSRRTGHAELAWATMHALHHEPMDVAANDTGGWKMEIYG